MSALQVGDTVKVIHDPHTMCRCDHAGQTGKVSYVVGYGTDTVAVTFCGHDTSPFSAGDLSKVADAGNGV